MLQLISLLSFFLPTQLSYDLSFLNINLNGFRIDYLTPTIYLTDIIIWLIIILGVRSIKITKRNIFISLFIVLFIVLNILVSDVWIASLYKWLRITELFLLAVIVRSIKKIDIFKNFIYPLSLSMIAVNLLGILQKINKGSIDGLFYFLGERHYLFLDPNISPYPYSTFSHSNSYAGFLLVFTILLIQFKNKFNVRYFYFSLILSVTGLILTNSLNVYLTIFILVLLLIFKNRKELVKYFLFIDYSLVDQKFRDYANLRFISHRIELIKSALMIIKENLLLGAGLNNFIPNLVKVNKYYINFWELQPVHNIFLLVLSEVGLIGFVVFVALLFFNFSIYNYPLIAILITGLSDHYWLTLQQNMLLFTFILSLPFNKSRSIKN